tara:strand:- start:1547 stop:1708 length:162 start_codon:yes stop_codon:yes gene_type:complete
MANTAFNNFWISDPLTIKIAGGFTQKVPSHEIHFIQPSSHSLMLSAHQLEISE